MNWIELLLSAVALILAAAAFRRSWSADPRKDANDVAILQAMQELRTVLDTLPGRIADEASASPLREAVEGVRESVRRLGDTLGDHLERQTRSQAEVRQALEAGMDGLVRGQEAMASRLEASGKSSAASLGGSVGSMEASMGKLAAEIGRIPAAVAQSSADISQAVAASGQKVAELVQVEVSRVGSAVAQGSAEVVRAVASGAELTADRVGQEVARSLPAPDTSSQEAVAAKLEDVVGGIRELSGLQREILRDSQSQAQAREQQGTAQVQAWESLQSRLDALSLLESIGTAVESVNAALETLGRELPVRIAQESAARPAPHPELEELAMAVRDSGHLRGDVGRQVAEAVGRVGQQLSESGARAEESRERAGQALDQALESLQKLASDLSGSLSPLAQALTGHGQVVAPLAAALDAAKDRLEEASTSLRANQVEFSSSVEVFTNGAQELQAGLALFAREGEKDGAEDPRAAQKALLEALERLLGGFAESLKAHLSESDLRLRETLAELAARLPAPHG